MPGDFSPGNHGVIMARFIIFTEVDDGNQARGDVAINADHIVGFVELIDEAKNSAGEQRPQCRLYLSSPMIEDDGTHSSYVDVLGGLLDTQQVLNYVPGRGDE